MSAAVPVGRPPPYAIVDDEPAGSVVGWHAGLFLVRSCPKGGVQMRQVSNGRNGHLTRSSLLTSFIRQRRFKIWYCLG